MAYIPKKKAKPRDKKSFGKDLFYNSTAWRKTSKARRKMFPICEVCKEKPSKVTDHIISRKQKGADYDNDNHIAMCNYCHNKKRGLEAHASGPLIPTKESEREDKLVPVDKNDIIELLTKKIKLW